MKRISVGMMMLAVLALCAFAASSASAALPELTKPGTKEAVVGELPGESEAGTKTVLETANGTTVKCEKAQSKGTVASGTKETKGTKIVFSGCTESLFGGKCNTKGKTVIETGELLGKIGYLSKPESKKTEVGLELRPAGTTEPELKTSFVVFECTGGFAKIEAKGAVIGTLGNGEHNKAVKSLKLVFEANGKGVQKDLGIEGGEMEEAHLESNLNGGKFEKSNQQGKGTISAPSGTEMELKA